MSFIRVVTIFLCVSLNLVVNLASGFALEYYVSNSGSDSNEGTSPTNPWQTLTKVNSFQFSPGDVVRFQRGGVWRQFLKPCSGSEKADVTYSSYGQGEKPLLLGSIEKNDPKEWKDGGGHVWSTFINRGLDVGNIIFDHGKNCGIKVWKESDLGRQNEFWYDDSRHVLKIYSARNPAEMFKIIECALTKPIINVDNRGYVVLEGLQAACGGGDGIKGESSYHITIRDCDIYFIGGGCQYGKMKNGQKVRFGNGVQFWNSARDNIVERCRIWEIYDAGISNQGRSGGNIQSNIIYRNNKIWNCEYSFEYWNDPETSVTQDIY